MDCLGLTLRYYSDKAHDRNEFEESKIPIQTIQKKLEQLQSEFGPNQQKINEIRVAASRVASIYCLLGSSIVIGQFAFIVLGTFHYLSWDIMEPLCYLMMFGNFTASYAFFLTQRTEHDLELGSIHHLLTERITRRRATASGIDFAKHAEQKEEIEKIEQFLRRYQI